MSESRWGDPLADVLWAEILAHPLDDEPRLVLADRLDEIGDADRAEFIHIQIERWICAHTGQRMSDRERMLMDREGFLIHEHMYDWRERLFGVSLFRPSGTMHGHSWAEFVRGFIGKICFQTPHAWVSAGDKIASVEPIEEVIFDAWAGWEQQIASQPATGQLRRLSLDSRSVLHLSGASMLLRYKEVHGFAKELACSMTSQARAFLNGRHPDLILISPQVSQASPLPQTT